MKQISQIVFAFIIISNVFAQGPHDPQLYGMTQYGGADHKGTIFHYTPSTQTYSVDYEFKIKAKGIGPKCEIVSDNNGKYYGTTTSGGAYNAGVIFSWDSLTNEYKEIFDFTMLDGADARGGMILYNNKFYGLTNKGGANDMGVIYEWDIATNIYTKKYDMDSINGKNPDGSLALMGNKFYGVTREGGAYNKGVLFEWNPTTNVYTKKNDFDSINGSNPVGKLMPFGANKLYAMTNKGGALDVGIIYEYDYVTDVTTKKFDFNNIDGAYPMGYLSLYNNKFYGLTYEGGIYQGSVPGEHFGVIFEWDPVTNGFVKKIDLGAILFSTYRSGHGSFSSLTLKGNNFWGTATEGIYGGVIFKWNPSTNVFIDQFYTFAGASQCEHDKFDVGSNCFGALFLSGNYLLGANETYGGSYKGSIYKYLPDSNQMVNSVHMGATNGSYPKGTLAKIKNKLYGLTYQGWE
jgi:uncharacterized repeat protein (TIGR03803 family)